ncbi:MAG: hypothetical protein L0271_03785 [Gemmatimonadetes bacterium]|nr:hypothetical protein [Gemmatimonadota bacterium]
MGDSPGIRLPEHLHAYFQDLDPSTLTVEAGRQTILRRLLERGGWDATVWLRREVGDTGIRRFLIATDGRGISPKRLRFWQLLLSIPDELVDPWIARYRASPWGQRGRP